MIHKLDASNPRHDCDIYNESCAMFLSNGQQKGAIDCSDVGLIAAVDSRELIGVELDQDDGFIARVVLGELNDQESEEWFAKATRILNIPDGNLVVAGGNAYVSDDYSAEDIDDDDEFYSVVVVPPGRYQVTVYQQLPFINGFRVTRLPDWKGFVPYWLETRPGEPMPGWLAEFADLEGENTDDFAINEGQEEELVVFVVQLQPAGDNAAESALEDDFYLEFETRLPPKCPLGISPVGIEQPEAVDDEQLDEEEKDRFTDDTNLAEHFRPFAEALYAEDYETAARFVVPAIRAASIAYMKSERQRVLENAQEGDDLPVLQPLHEIWRDGEKAETTLPRWRSGAAERGTLLAADVANDESYLCEIRCEYGNNKDYIEGKFDAYVMVDTLVVRTDDGPMLAGIVFL